MEKRVKARTFRITQKMSATSRLANEILVSRGVAQPHP